MTKKILACIVTFNSGELVVDSVRCIKNQTIEVDVLIIDNNSSTYYQDFLKNSIKEVHFIFSDQNKGYTGGNNIAIDYARKYDYDYLFLINPDVDIGINVFESLISTIDSEPGIGIVGCKEVDFYTGKVRSIGGGPYNFWVSRTCWLSEREVPDPSCSSLRVEFCQGALVLLSRNILRENIRLSDEIFAYVDEVDFGIKVQRSGYSIVVNPSVSFGHKIHNPPFRPIEGYLLQRNRVFIVRKYGMLRHKITFFLYMTLIEIPVKCIFRLIQGRHEYAFACFVGFLDGIVGKMGMGSLIYFSKKQGVTR